MIRSHKGVFEEVKPPAPTTQLIATKIVYPVHQLNSCHYIRLRTQHASTNVLKPNVIRAGTACVFMLPLGLEQQLVQELGLVP